MRTKYFWLFALILIPLFLFRDFTPDNELRYLSIANEALHNGTWFIFYNHGIIYTDKPPLYFWIIMLGKWLFGIHSMLFLCLFSLTPALVIIYLMNKWTTELINVKNCPVAQLMLMSSAYFLGAAAIVRMDMLMCMFIVLALYTFYKMYHGEQTWRNKFLFPVWVFLALFTKGPLGFLIPLLSIFTFLILEKKLKTFGQYWGWITWGILLVACTLWLGAVYEKGGSTYLENLLFHQTFNRAINAFAHRHPFYYYFESVWYVVAPWSLLIAGTLAVAVRKKLIQNDLERFFLTIIVVTFAMLSCFSSKVDIYLLPTLPFLVYLTTIMLQKTFDQLFLKWLNAIQISIVTLAIPLSWVLLRNPLAKMGIMIYIASGFLFVCGCVSVVLLFKEKYMNRSIQLFSVSLLITIFLVSFIIPQINDRIGYGALAKEGLLIAQKRNIHTFYFYKLRRGENMDVYLQYPIKPLQDQDLTKDEKLHGILFYRKDDLNCNRFFKGFVQGKKKVQKGNYGIAIL